jgi:hypothetical protein
VALSIVGLAVAVLTWQFPDLRLWSATEGEIDGSVEFDFDEGAVVPRCAALSGTAPQREGYTLWFANAESGGAYYVKEIDRHVGDEWEIRTTIGGDDSPGLRANVFVFYVDNDTSSFLQSIHGVASDEGPGYWSSELLPPTAAAIAETTVTRDADPDSPSC